MKYLIMLPGIFTVRIKCAVPLKFKKKIVSNSLKYLILSAKVGR